MKFGPCWVAAMLLGPVVVQSQTSHHAVTGVVLDSLRARPLAGAEIILEGTAHSATADSLGRFTFDALPPGKYRVGLFHPYLDSLSLSVGARILQVPMETGQAVVLAIPSAATIIRAICPLNDDGASSILMGTVLDAETDAPIHGAEISIAWVNYKADGKEGLVRTPRTILTTTDSVGAYIVCGIPAELQALATASRGGDTTAQISVSSNRPDVVLRTFTLATGAGQSGKAGVSGIVRGPSGDPMQGVRVSVPGTREAMNSGADGRFTLKDLPSGTRNVSIRRVGYVPLEIPVHLTSRVARHFEVVLEKYVPVLDTMFIRGRRTRALADVGFNKRRAGGIGQYRTGADIQKTNPRYLSDILITMRGIGVEDTEGKRVLRPIREASACLRMVIDGVQWEEINPGDFDQMVSPADIAALEVYSGASVPPEFERFGNRGCLTVVVWTRGRVREGP